MIRVITYEPDYDVIPQAIFWRPLRYFSASPREGEDGLDHFQAVSFIIGNNFRFDLRAYRGHPDFTVTMYLPEGVSDPPEIASAIRRVIRTLVVPAAAVAWRRGEAFGFSSPLTRPRVDRLRETEARILALKIAAQRPNRTASTTFIKNQIPEYTALSPIDLRPSPTRGNEKKWQQVVGNVISHQESAEGPFVKGYATRTTSGLSVTEKGVAYLNNMGFSVAS